MAYKIVALGEVLWDLLPGGRQLGGAPANFTCHAHALGAEARMITRVGDDDLGREVLDRFRARGLPCDTIQVDSRAPTGTVGVSLDAAGQPTFEIHRNVAWDNIVADDAALAAVAHVDAVCFGSLAQRCETSRAAIHTLVRAVPAKALRVFDVNLRPPFFSQDVIESSLRLANIFKLNEDELDVLAKMFGLPGETNERIAALASRFDLSLIAMTRGSRGSVLYSKGQWSDLAGVPVQVRDSVGAGDAFTATMILGYLRGEPLDAINRRAGAIAAYVCSQDGATPILPANL